VQDSISTSAGQSTIFFLFVDYRKGAKSAEKGEERRKGKGIVMENIEQGA